VSPRATRPETKASWPGRSQQSPYASRVGRCDEAAGEPAQQRGEMRRTAKKRERRRRRSAMQWRGRNGWGGLILHVLVCRLIFMGRRGTTSAHMPWLGSRLDRGALIASVSSSDFVGREVGMCYGCRPQACCPNSQATSGPPIVEMRWYSFASVPAIPINMVCSKKVMQSYAHPSLPTILLSANTNHHRTAPLPLLPSLASLQAHARRQLGDKGRVDSAQLLGGCVNALLGGARPRGVESDGARRGGGGQGEGEGEGVRGAKQARRVRRE